MSLEKTVYTAHAKATGGRDGRVTTDDQLLDIQLAVPKEMGGPGGGTNPEQLFAAGYSACFLGAMKFVANRDKLNMSKEAYIEGEVGIGPIPTGFGIEVTLNVHLEGMDQDEAQKLVVRQVLVDDVAQQIARQISSNRLPLAKPETPTQPAP